MRRRMCQVAPVAGLFFLAPFVAEFLLGNLRIDQLAVLPLFGLLYGAGALLIREMVRRAHRGWPTIVLLAAAYGLLEEGPVDQLLWNPSYGGNQHMLLGEAYIPALGTNLSVVQAVLSLHTIWSISVPISLIETFVPQRRTSPWMNRTGLTITALLFALGVTAGYRESRGAGQFRATFAEIGGVTVVIAALIVMAFTLPYRARPIDRVAPNPWLVGALTLVLTSLLLVTVMFWPARLSQWVSVAAWCVVATTLAALIAQWSRHHDWGAAHRLAPAAGALLTYAWIAFPHRSLGGRSDGRIDTVDLIGNTVFALLALALIVLAARVVRRTEHPVGAV